MGWSYFPGCVGKVVGIMNRDTVIHITFDAVIWPLTGLSNTKMILFADSCGRYWQLIPNTNPQIMMPFIIFPLSKKQYEEIREKEK